MTNESTELRMIIVATVVKGINKLVYDTVTVTLAELNLEHLNMRSRICAETNPYGVKSRKGVS